MIEKAMIAIQRLRAGGNARVSEFCPLVPMSRWKFDRLVEAGQIKPLTVGGLQLIPPAEAKKFLPGLLAA
jgi:hypothetical protein